MTRPRRLDWMVEDLTQRVPSALHAVVLSSDGLPIGVSRGLTREDSEHLAAMAAGFQGLARSASRQFAAGAVRQTVVEMDEAYFFVSAAGQGACLAVLAGADADLGVVAYEMAMLVVRVGADLSAPTRTRPEEAGGDVG